MPQSWNRHTWKFATVANNPAYCTHLTRKCSKRGLQLKKKIQRVRGAFDSKLHHILEVSQQKVAFWKFRSWLNTFRSFERSPGLNFQGRTVPTQHLCENLKFRFLKLILSVSSKLHEDKTTRDKGFMTTVSVGRYRNINQTATTCGYVGQSSSIMEPTLLQNVRAFDRGNITWIFEASSCAFHRAPISHEDCNSVHPVVVYHIDTDVLTWNFIRFLNRCKKYIWEMCKIFTFQC
jgi:hypothetical protein